MWKALRFAPLAILAIAAPLYAQSWSFGAATGPFIFGKFYERTLTLTNGSTTGKSRSTLSAETRAGGSLDVGHDLNRWLGVRLEGTWTRAPLRLKSTSGDQGFTIDAGKINVTTISLPFIISFSRHGAFRFSLLGGPAYAMYDVTQTTSAGSSSLFDGSRSRWGVVGGAELAWWWSDRFAVEGGVQDIVTSSPFERTDFRGITGGVKTLRPQNVHTTVGLRYRF